MTSSNSSDVQKLLNSLLNDQDQGKYKEKQVVEYLEEIDKIKEIYFEGVNQGKEANKENKQLQEEEEKKLLNNIKKQFPKITQAVFQQIPHYGKSLVLTTEELHIYTRERTYKAKLGSFRILIGPGGSLQFTRYDNGIISKVIHPHVKPNGEVCLGTLIGEWHVASDNNDIMQQVFLSMLFLQTMNDGDFYTDPAYFDFKWTSVVNSSKSKRKKLTSKNPFLNESERVAQEKQDQLFTIRRARDRYRASYYNRK